MTSYQALRAATITVALGLGTLGSPAVAIADDPDAVPQAMLNTQCSLDQMMAATEVVDPIT